MMMRAIPIALLALFVSFQAAAEDYVLTVNGVSTEIGLGKGTSLVTSDGQRLSLMLRQKEFLRFAGEMFSFEHKNEYKPNRTDLGDGILQTMIVTPVGTGILIQEYKRMNPDTLIDLMLKELTKEEVQYGYVYSERPVEKRVKAAVLRGKEATTTYKDEEWKRSVLAYGNKDRGVLVVTFIEKDNYRTETALIDQMWRTLAVRLD